MSIVKISLISFVIVFGIWVFVKFVPILLKKGMLVFIGVSLIYFLILGFIIKGEVYNKYD